MPHEYDMVDEKSPGGMKWLVSSEKTETTITAIATESTKTRFRFCSPRWWARACRDVARDFKAVGWKRSSETAGFACITILIPLTVLILLIGHSVLFSVNFGYERSACRPDDSFRPYTGGYNTWETEGFFQITVPFGTLTFTQVKVIDVMWDLFVGRGGQTVLAFVSWKAFAVYLLSVMGTDKITYATFLSIYVQEGTTVRSTFRLLRDNCARRKLPSILAAVAMLSTMVFILAWPTLASAMTGYKSASMAFVNDYSNNLVPFSHFVPISWIVHDGQRINQTENLILMMKDNRVFQESSDPMVSQDEVGDYDMCIVDENSFLYTSTEALYSLNCNLTRAVTEYVGKYGVYGLNADGEVNDIETIFMTQTIPAPSLNISGFYIPRYRNPSEDFAFLDPLTGRQEVSDSKNVAFTLESSNETYPMVYIQGYGTCQALDTYQWGFSFLQLFMSSLLMLLWGITVTVLGAIGRADLKYSGDKKTPGRYRSVLLLAEAMKAEFKVHGEVADASGDDDHISHLITELSGGGIGMEKTETIGHGRVRTSRGKRVLKWAKREAWWIALTMVMTGLWVLLFALVWPIMATLSAMAVGSTTRSRLMMLGVGVILGLVHVTVFLVQLPDYIGILPIMYYRY